MGAKIKSNELAREIIQSNEFRELLQAKQIIDRSSEYQKKIRELAQKQAELQKIIIPDANKGKSKADEIRNFYNQIITNAEIKNYFVAEQKFNVYLAETFKVINDVIDKSLK